MGLKSDILRWGNVRCHTHTTWVCLRIWNPQIPMDCHNVPIKIGVCPILRHTRNYLYGCQEMWKQHLGYRVGPFLRVVDCFFFEPKIGKSKFFGSPQIWVMFLFAALLPHQFVTVWYFLYVPLLFWNSFKRQWSHGSCGRVWPRSSLLVTPVLNGSRTQLGWGSTGCVAGHLPLWLWKIAVDRR